MFKFIGKVALGTVVVVGTLYVMNTPERMHQNKLARAKIEAELRYRAIYDSITHARNIELARIDSVRKVEIALKVTRYQVEQARYRVAQKDRQITEQCRFYAATQVEEEQAYRDCVIGKSLRGREIRAGKNLVQL